MFEMSSTNLPNLHGGSRMQLGGQSSMLSRSRRSTSSMMSLGEGGSQGGRHRSRSFKPVSYNREKRIAATNEVYQAYRRVQAARTEQLGVLIKEKAHIVTAMTRARAHIDALNQESEEREANIKATLEVLRCSKGDKRIEGQPPSISQLRQVSNTILREGLRFKARSEQPKRIESEADSIEQLNDGGLDVENQQAPEEKDIGKCIEFQRVRLSGLVFKKEDAKLRLETIMSNRDMLTRVIFDHKTALEALRLKKQTLTDESERLAQEFERMLVEVSEQLGEIVWKNAMVRACKDISMMPKG